MNNEEEKLELMLSLQEGVNSIINPQWKSAGQAWHRAIWMECAEILDREGDWKWWKAAPKFESDHARAQHREQQQIELCDIWHFVLSWALEEDQPAARLLPAAGIADDEDKNACIEALVAQAIARDLPGLLPHFHAACRIFGLGFDRLFELYVGKNVVNRFRQDRGYKTGGYRKRFGGMEDNEHLSEIMAGLTDTPIFELADTLYEKLSVRYEKMAD